MTTARPWPNQAAQCRDEAAAAIVRAQRLIETERRREHSPARLLFLMELYVAVSNAGGWLQRAGAPITPAQADALPLSDSDVS